MNSQLFFGFEHRFYIRHGKAWLVVETVEDSSEDLMVGGVNRSTYHFMYAQDDHIQRGCGCQRSTCPFGLALKIFHRSPNDLLELGRFGVRSVTHPPEREDFDAFLVLIHKEKMRCGSLGRSGCGIGRRSEHRVMVKWEQQTS